MHSLELQKVEFCAPEPSPVQLQKKTVARRCLLVVTFALIFASVLFHLPLADADVLSPWHLCPHRPFLTFDQQALNILSDHPLVDGHNDLLILIRALYHNHINSANFTDRFESGGLESHVDIPRLDQGKSGGAFWSAWYLCPKDIFDFSDQNYAAIVRATLEQIDLFHRLSERYPHYFTPPSTAAEGLAAFYSPRRTLVSPLAIEGLHQIGNSLSTLRVYHSLGVRYATLTWNCHNVYADAAVLTYGNGTTTKSIPYWGGLSLKGRELVKEMNRLGMIVDLSHVSQDTMKDVLVGEHNDNGLRSEHNGLNVHDEHWTGSIAPPIFSHSSAYAICPHPRNVPDDVLELVAQRNSVVMINFSPAFISCVSSNSSYGIPDFYPQNATLAQVVRHITYIGERIGYAHVGIGSDFDGIESTPRGLEDVSKFPDLVAELLRQGVSNSNVIKVIGGNVMRVWAEVDTVSKKLRKGGMQPAEDDLNRPF